MLIDDYVGYLKSVEGKSNGTISQYKISVTLFTKYMKEYRFSITRESIKKVKVPDIYGFLDSLVKEDPKDKMNNKNGSRRNKISALKSFFEYCKTIELITHNIIVDLKKQPKIPTRLPKYFNLEQIKHLLESVGKRNYTRDKLMIVLFLNTGLRLAELIKLNTDCIKDDDLTIIGKGDKERNIFLSAPLINSIKEYLEQRPKTDNPALFISERGNRIGKGAVQNVLRTTIKRAGLKTEDDSDVLVHILRHSFATIKYQTGTDIIELQYLLGHEDIVTTKRYVQVDKRKMKEHADNSIMNTII
ncbi:tyrosine-type recombinase/integrase [Clostridium estertheticum]|uniref:tyrosine-type recombinase/integrase n=1 Tax=Clostridium estertheticum TaxID=238834 RepID=UPI001C0B58D3|nr:tyrosine-type recombinase/integrase [Clostridium estertheticum]MBU3186597.1 tyrosine-type recombinase/integrase [Clostridium estertheticum]